MVRKLKNALYFSVAAYFAYFARIRLSRWKPRIVVVTGSNGKTTALHLMEAALGKNARYSHGANSSFGIPFDILGLKRESYSPLEWIALACKAPFFAWRKPYAEAIYVVEADCDRPHEGEFLSRLLKPEVVVWLSSARTHSMNFDKEVRAGKFASVEEAIAHEFGNFIERAGALAIVNGDNPLILRESKGAHANVSAIPSAQLQHYQVANDGTTFVIGGITYRFPYLLPREICYSILAALKAAEYFGVKADDLSAFSMPAGRSSIFTGIKNTAIVDSSYNVNSDSLAAIVAMVRQMPPAPTWMILGDMTEQGAEEQEEHEKVAHIVADAAFARVILVGPRLATYALPLIRQRGVPVETFIAPKDALEYLKMHLEGGERLVFKGARFLEGIIEHLLADPADADMLCRREDVWRTRRAQWGL